MAEQGNLFTPSNESAAAIPPDPRHRHIPHWLLIIEVSLFVILRLYVGVLVVLLPWRSVWTTNAWINTWPTLANFIAQGWVRGIVSGLGLLNIWIAFSALFRRQRRY
jgi:hypothetical protein